MKGQKLIKATAYTNPETIVINSLRGLAATMPEDGWKVELSFRDENEMKALQDALNYRFPENMKTMQGMPTEDGYYLTQTGTLLYRASCPLIYSRRAFSFPGVSHSTIMYYVITNR